MTQEAIYQQVTALIKEHKGDDFEIKDNVPIQEDFFTDSVEFMEFIIALEETFDLEISDETADSLSTVADLVAYLYKEKGNEA